MKYKYIISIFILGFICQLVASMLKILHHANANYWVMFSVGIMIFAALLLIIKIITNSNSTSILNK